MMITTKKCPMCAEQIPSDSVLCPFCGTHFGEDGKVTPPPAQTLPAPPLSFPSSPAKKSHAGLWITGALVLVVILGTLAALLWTQRAKISALFAPSATSTPTLAPTSPPTITPTRTTSPTATATPLPAWVSNFAQPILDAIADRPPTFQDDFGLASAGWISSGWCRDQMDILDGELVVPGCTDAFHSGLDYPDFVVELDGRFLPDVTGGGSWDIGFRRLTCSGCSFSVDFDGSVSIDRFDGNDDVDFPDSARNGYLTNHLLMIAKGNKYAFYINAQPLYYFEEDSSRWGGILLSVSRRGNLPTSDPVFVAFDNLKLWDIYNLP